MNIKQAKQQVEYAVKAYLTLDELGQPAIPVERQRPIFLMGAPGIGRRPSCRRSPRSWASAWWPIR